MAFLGRVDVPDGGLGREEAQELQEGVWEGIPRKQEGHVPVHPLKHPRRARPCTRCSPLVPFPIEVETPPGSPSLSGADPYRSSAAQTLGALLRYGNAGSTAILCAFGSDYGML